MKSLLAQLVAERESVEREIRAVGLALAARGTDLDWLYTRLDDLNDEIEERQG